jgi:hypothetical protein
MALWPMGFCVLLGHEASLDADSWRTGGKEIEKKFQNFQICYQHLSCEKRSFI